MTVYPFNVSNNLIELRDTIYSVLANSSRFNEKIFKTFSEAYSVYLKTTLEEYSPPNHAAGILQKTKAETKGYVPKGAIEQEG